MSWQDDGSGNLVWVDDGSGTALDTSGGDTSGGTTGGDTSGGTTTDTSGSGYTTNSAGDKTWSDQSGNTTVIKADGTILVNGQNMGSTSGSDTSVGSTMMGILSSLGTGAMNTLKGLVSSNGKIDASKLAAIAGGILGGIGSGSSWASAQSKPTGYQGGIPSLTAVREQVPGTYDPTRRPGSRGQEYFTQQQFVSPSNVTTAQATAAQQATEAEARNKAREAEYKAAQPRQGYAAGGIAGYYLGGKTDGMADKIPATIGGNRPAKLSDGEFVVPADVVSHLGNGNSQAGADRLYSMMDKIRKARTGTTKQGRQINPNKFMPG